MADDDNVPDYVQNAGTLRRAAGAIDVAAVRAVAQREAERMRAAAAAAAAAADDNDVAMQYDGPTMSVERQRQVQEQLERARAERAVAVPTVDGQVKLLLRKLGEPIILFAEDAAPRRERLRALLGAMQMRGEALPSLAEEERRSTLTADEARRETFFTEGTEELRQARMFIAQYSLPRARVRLERAQAEQAEALKDTAAYLHRLEETDEAARARFKSYSCTASNFCGDRVVTCVNFSPQGDQVAASTLAGDVHLYSVPDCAPLVSFQGHRSKVHAAVFHPSASARSAAGAVFLASASSDTTGKLWDATGTCLATLEGHTERLGSVAFHPSGRFVGTTSFDHTWRLWDVERHTCLVEQEGHSRPVYGIAFQCDGSLCVTSGVDASIRVWDLRVGRSIMNLLGHVEQVIGLDFHPNGVTVASGSDDNTIRIWDLRKRVESHSLPAHVGMVTCVRFEPDHGRFLLSSSFDGTCKVWSTADYTLHHTLVGHADKVAHCDVARSTGTIATAGWDKTWKLWAEDELASL